MRRISVGLVAGLLGLLLTVSAALGRAEGWSSGQYRDSLNQALASGMLVTSARQK
jgi:hypothetical protein